MISFSLYRNKEHLTGFTLIELMVVVTIMLLMITVVTVNNNTDKTVREINIAQSQLITNIRKVQSYALASRTLPGGQVVQFYTITFDALNAPDQYTIQALYNVNSTSTLPSRYTIETVKLPGNIRLRTINGNAFSIVRGRGLGTVSLGGCIIVGFKLPFAKTLVNEGCNFNNFSTSPVDDFRSLIDYSQNVAGNPTTADSQITIILEDKNQPQNTRTVRIQGASGIINAN